MQYIKESEVTTTLINQLLEDDNRITIIRQSEEGGYDYDTRDDQVSTGDFNGYGSGRLLET